MISQEIEEILGSGTGGGDNRESNKKEKKGRKSDITVKKLK